MPSRHTRATTQRTHGRNTTYERTNVEDALMRGQANLTPLELGEAVRRLTRRGMSARLIAEYLGCSDRAVVRHRARLRTAYTDLSGDWREWTGMSS